MRLALTALLLLGVLTAVHHAQKGSEDDPLPEDHEDDGEDAEEAGHDDEENENEEAEEEETDPLMNTQEDKGEGESLTQDTLRHLHKQFDKNGDGKASIHEIMEFHDSTRKAVAKKEIASIFNEIPSTQDGHLSLEEHMSEVTEFHEGDDAEKEMQRQHDLAKFKAADTNGDDKLDIDELVHLMHPETHADVLQLHAAEEMRKRDTDKDGKLSKKEWDVDHNPADNQEGHGNAHHEDDFENLDENKDGFLDVEELKHWESGRYHTISAMQKLIKHGDKDDDEHFTADELANLVDDIDGHDAQPHLLDWALHEDL